MSICVHKYGGTSVADIGCLRRVAGNISSAHERGQKVIAVVSAMGDWTDRLTEQAKSLSSDPCERELDLLLASGERITSALLAIALNDIGIGSKALTGSQCGILTDGQHGQARIVDITGERIQEVLDEDKVAIIAGFQGVNPETKDVTTLGRGGSDLTAIALAHRFSAETCEVFSDVSGVHSANPNAIDGTFKREQIPWREMTHLADFGAQIIHSRAAELAEAKKVPYRVRSSKNLEDPGTLVGDVTPREVPSVTALAAIDDVFDIKADFIGPTDALGMLADGFLYLQVNRDGSTTQARVVGQKSEQERVRKSLDDSSHCERYQLREKRVLISLVGNILNKVEGLDEQLIAVLETGGEVLAASSQHIQLLVSAEASAEIQQELHDKLVVG